MSRNMCLVCGTSYTGWTCPRCAAREETERRERELRRHERWQTEEHDRVLQEQERLAEEAAENAREAAWRMEEAAAEQRDAVANAPFLQADAQADRAYDLYRAGLTTDALHHARQALHLDRAHLLAHKVAASCLAASGAHREAGRHYEALIALLRTSEYASDPSAHRGVIDWLPDDPQLLARAEETVLAHAPQWNNAIRTGCLDLLELLVTRQRYATASRLVNSLLQQHPDFYLHAYRLEIIQRASASNDKLPDQEETAALADLTRYLAVPEQHVQRSDLRTALVGLQQRAFVSKQTLTQLRRQLAEQYREWRPSIARSLTQENQGQELNLGASILASGGMAVYLFYLWQRPRWNWNTGEEFVISAVIEAVLLGWFASALSARRHQRQASQYAMASEDAAWAWTRSAHAIASGKLDVKASAAATTSRFGRAVLVCVLLLIAIGILRWYLQPTVRASATAQAVAESSSGGGRRRDFLARIRLDARRPWTFVAQTKAGQRLRVVTTGTWRGDPADPMVGASGQDARLCASPECPLPGYRHSALIGRVGRGAPFAIDQPASFEFTPATNGPLEMAINDHSCCLGDNRGALDVIVLRISP
jgi:tetratricopeptide (TPR) repeat protein